MFPGPQVIKRLIRLLKIKYLVIDQRIQTDLPLFQELVERLKVGFGAGRNASVRRANRISM
jgi:hypothetical protein